MTDLLYPHSGIADAPQTSPPGFRRPLVVAFFLDDC